MSPPGLMSWFMVGFKASIGSNKHVRSISKEPVSYNDSIRPLELFGSDENFPFGFNDPDRTTVTYYEHLGSDGPFGSNDSFGSEKPSESNKPCPLALMSLLSPKRPLERWAQ